MLITNGSGQEHSEHILGSVLSEAGDGGWHLNIGHGKEGKSVRGGR